MQSKSISLPCCLPNSEADTLLLGVMDNTRWTVSTNNVNFSFKAAGTNAAHRLNSVPISEMGQLALKTTNLGKKGEPALFDRNNTSKYFPFHTGKEMNI